MEYRISYHPITSMPTELDALRANAERHAEEVRELKAQVASNRAALESALQQVRILEGTARSLARHNDARRGELVQLASVVRNISGSDDPGSVVYTAHLIEASAYAIDTFPADCECED